MKLLWKKMQKKKTVKARTYYISTQKRPYQDNNHRYNTEKRNLAC